MASIDTETLSPLHWVGILLAAITGIIHLWLGFEFIAAPLGWSFLAAGLGFFGAIALVLVNIRRPTVYLVGVPFILIQIILWWIINDITVQDLFEPGIGVFDKLVQVILIVVILALYSRET